MALLDVGRAACFDPGDVAAEVGGRADGSSDAGVETPL